MSELHGSEPTDTIRCNVESMEEQALQLELSSPLWKPKIAYDIAFMLTFGCWRGWELVGADSRGF
jgi:hypothetical protein